MITDRQFSQMVSLKVPHAVMEITKRLAIPYSEAFDMFYDSETYRLLSDKDTYYWGESALFVADSFLREHEGLPIEEF